MNKTRVSTLEGIQFYIVSYRIIRVLDSKQYMQQLSIFYSILEGNKCCGIKKDVKEGK